MKMRFVCVLLSMVLVCGSLLQAGLSSNSADINNDKEVNMRDFADFSAAWFGNDIPTVNWNPSCDISDPHDDIIDVQDLGVLAVNWLWYWSPGDPVGNPADIYDDGKVDMRDFAVFYAGWLGDDVPTANWNQSCDISDPNDDVIDMQDLNLLATNWLWYWLPPDPGQFAYIPSGDFEMGDHHDGDADADAHTVYIDSFYMSKYEVTNQQYCDYLNSAILSGGIKVDGGVVYAFDDSSNSYLYCETTASSTDSHITWDESRFEIVLDKEEHPMMMVTWYGSVAYCNWMSIQDGFETCYDMSTWECDFNKEGYRLPTEAQWEYAARGGEHAPYYRYPWGDSIDGSNANYWSSGDAYETGDYPWTTPVGQYTDMPNGYGLSDMAGNIHEWCNEWYDSSYYKDSTINNPTGPASGIYRILRGGGWNYSEALCQVANRSFSYPSSRGMGIGFRVCLAVSSSD